MSDIEKWKWFPLSVASSLIPGNPHPATVVRWALKGVKAGPNGERVKLATRKVGGATLHKSCANRRVHRAPKRNGLSPGSCFATTRGVCRPSRTGDGCRRHHLMDPLDLQR